jgi:hypothetical protein
MQGTHRIRSGLLFALKFIPVALTQTTVRIGAIVSGSPAASYRGGGGAPARWAERGGAPGRMGPTTATRRLKSYSAHGSDTHPVSNPVSGSERMYFWTFS